MSQIINDVFLPASTDLIAGLVAQYRATKASMEELVDVFRRPDINTALSIFIEAATHDERGGYHRLPSDLFDLKKGIATLNAHYWSKAIQQTAVLDVMPQKRRNEWHAMINERKCPEFTEEVVRDTLADLLASRWKFFAERVDGIFKALSGDHVTNSPSGFYKRMIMAHVFTEWGSVSYGGSGQIADLRKVVAKLEGREEPDSQSTDALLKYARANTGEWVPCDGGRFKVKAFLVGTCHIEVHPDIAVMLNTVLASLYPAAIPARFRQKNTKPAKDWPLIQRPLPVAVLNLLGNMRQATEPTGDHRRGNGFRNIPNSATLNYGDIKSPAFSEAVAVLEAIGGVHQRHYFLFDYNPFPVINLIVASGTIPDKKSHQFYPTPAELAGKAFFLADIEPEHHCLEPSAGTGNLAGLMHAVCQDKLTCVEVSKLHAEVLREKGYRVLNRDFLGINPDIRKFDRILMNPPFSEGRWQAHLQHAAKFLATGGRLVAILPASARNADPLPYLQCEWHGPYDNQFPDASVSVVILVAQDYPF